MLPSKLPWTDVGLEDKLVRANPSKYRGTFISSRRRLFMSSTQSVLVYGLTFLATRCIVSSLRKYRDGVPGPAGMAGWLIGLFIFCYPATKLVWRLSMLPALDWEGTISWLYVLQWGGGQTHSYLLFLWKVGWKSSATICRGTLSGQDFQGHFEERWQIEPYCGSDCCGEDALHPPSADRPEDRGFFELTVPFLLIPLGGRNFM